MEILEYKIFKKKEVDKVFFNRLNSLNYLIKNNTPIIFDVGGNVGQSIEEFKSAWSNSYIYSFEPDKNVYNKLIKFQNEQIFCYNFALGDKIEKKELNIYKETGNNSFLSINEDNNMYKSNEHPKLTNGAKKVGSQECSVQTLDTFCLEKGIEKIDILKIDVQGYENNVLIGSKNFLKNSGIDVIIVEIIFDNIYGKENTFYNIESILKEFGYKFWDISHIYKDLKKGRTIWIDAIYVSEEKFKSIENE